MKTDSTTTTDDPIAEIHEIRRRLAAKHENDPHRMGDAIRARAKLRDVQRVRVEKQLVPAVA